MDYRFSTRLAVRWSDVDAAGVVNNAVYFSLVEQARFEYFGRLGILRGQQFPFLLGETSARFHRSARAGMKLEVFTKVVRLGEKSLEMAYEVQHDGALLATLRATLVHVDEGLSSEPIPDSVRGAISQFEGISPRGS
jgi:acyl-CoA thioester hydrolase